MTLTYENLVVIIITIIIAALAGMLLLEYLQKKLVLKMVRNEDPELYLEILDRLNPF